MKKILFTTLLFLSPTLVFGATTIFMEPGTDATQDLTFWGTAVTSGVNVNTTNTVSHTGPRSIRINTTAGAGEGYLNTSTGVLTNTGRRISFWWRADQIVNSTLMYSVNSSNSAVIFALKIASGVFQINPVGASTVSGTFTPAANTWYRVSISYTITNSTTWTIKVYVNGVLDITASSNGTLTTTATSIFRIMCNSATANLNFWFDDIYIDDGSDFSDTGGIRVTAKRPVANGAFNQC